MILKIREEAHRPAELLEVVRPKLPCFFNIKQLICTPLITNP